MSAELVISMPAELVMAFAAFAVCCDVNFLTLNVHNVQFLSMKLGAVNSHENDGIAFQSKDVSLVDDSKQFISATELAAFWKRKLSSCILEKITELPGDHEKNHGKSCFCTCLSFWLNISN